MVAKVIHDGGKHVNLHEGSHVGFHPKGKTWKDGCTLVVEGRSANAVDSLTIEIEPGSNSEVYVMNDAGKTIEHIHI